MSYFNWIAFAFVCACGVLSVVPLKEKVGGNSRRVLSEIIERYSSRILILILAVGLFARFYKIDELPVGFHVDEAAMAYDAYCLKEYGTDRYLNANPVYLINYGGGQSVLMAYLVSFAYRIFGTGTVFAIRFPAAFMGTASILFVFLITKKIFGKTAALLGAFFMAVFPTCIKMSRFGLDCYLMYSFVCLSVWLFALAVEKQENLYFVLAGTAWGITLYTYAISYIFVPVFLAVSVLYLLWIRRIRWKQLLFAGIPLGLLALPLILVLIVNNGLLNEISTDFITIPLLPLYRGGEISFSNVCGFVDALYNALIFDGWLYNSDLVYNTTYIAAIPLICIGLIKTGCDFVKSVRGKNFSWTFLLVSYIMGALLLMCVVSGPCVNKLNALYPLFAILSAVGLAWVSRRFDVVLGAVLCVFAGYFLIFTVSYFDDVNYAGELPLFSSNIAPAIETVEKLGLDGDVYVCDNMMDIKYEAVALALQPSPQEYQENLESRQIGRYHVKVPVYFDEDGELREELYEDCIYIIRTSNESETYSYITEKLKKMGFEKLSIEYYDIYYNP